MADADHLAILTQGVGLWNDWRKRMLDLQPDLSGAELRDADVCGANFSGANLRHADLRGADLDSADMTGADLGNTDLRGANLRAADLSWSFLGDADLRGANLSEAVLCEANLTGADLVRADLSEADLRGANLRGVNLFGADLTGADLSESAAAFTKFDDLDLTAVKGLETVRHQGPSTIGIDTIYRSHGELPDAFMRGAGVPETLIGFISSLRRKDVRHFSCFICHSSRDKRFCDRLCEDLQSNGIRTWYFPEEVKRGNQFLEAIELNLGVFDRIILVCSRHSLQSGPVIRELERTLAREEHDGQVILFPIRTDDYVLEGWSHPRQVQLLDRGIEDFTNWRRSEEKYNNAFRNLFNRLVAETHLAR